MELEKRVFAASADNFNELALELFNYQYQNNEVYRQYCNLLKVRAGNINSPEKIPFLPISFFKSHIIKTTEFEPDIIFESSGTTKNISRRGSAPALPVERERSPRAPRRGRRRRRGWQCPPRGYATRPNLRNVVPWSTTNRRQFR